MTDPGLLGLALLALAGFAAGAVNSVAGGGSLISFPALLAAGFPSVTANVTNQVAVLPGFIGGTVGYRRELRGQGRRVAALSVTSAVGAVCGAALLVAVPPSVFEAIVPFLVLFSCALLAVQPVISRRAGATRDAGAAGGVGLHAMVFAASLYGGYFGAALGIMLVAVLALGLGDSLQRLNALKGVLSLVVCAAAVALLALVTPIAWVPGLVMGATSYAGGQVGAGVARRMSGRGLRAVILVYGVAVGVWLLLD